jgi:hypothetical protein
VHPFFYTKMTKLIADWLTAAFTVVIAVTGIWALIYARGQIREAHAEAQVQHLLAFDTEYRSEPLVTYRRTDAQKRLQGLKEPAEESELLDFFEGVALLANRGYLNDEDVYDLFGWDILSLYADQRASIDEERKDDPTEYVSLVHLVPRLEVIDEARRGTLAKPTKDDLVEYWKEESAVGVGTPAGHKQPGAK